MEEEKLPRREREKIRQRQEILAAALELFSQKGFHNVGMHEIAEKVEFAIGTLYKFFENKEDLYTGLVTQESAKFGAAILPVLDRGGDAAEVLREFVRTKVSTFRQNLAFVRVFFAESVRVSFNVNVTVSQEVHGRYLGMLQKLSALVERGMVEKRFVRIGDAFQLAVAIDSSINSLLMLWLESPDEHPMPQDPSEILNFFFQGLLQQ